MGRETFNLTGHLFLGENYTGWCLLLLLLLLLLFVVLLPGGVSQDQFLLHI